MIIENGGHEGNYKLVISPEGHAGIDAVIETEDRHANIKHEKVWSLPFELIDPVGADDYFLYIKNTSSANFAVKNISLETSVVGTAEVHSVSGTPTFTAGVDIVPVNMHIGSSLLPTATIKTDTDTTGLTNNGVLLWLNLSTADVVFDHDISSNIIIPPGQAIAVMWDTATGILKGMVSLVELT